MPGQLIMVRGRPVKSKIRQNIVDILYFLGEGYAYDIYKIYRDLFPKVTMRSVYYHLKKGISTKEFMINCVKKEQGDYSWGHEVEKTYYALGPSARPTPNNEPGSHIKQYIDRRPKVEAR
jgi:hypothetical protein